MRLGSRTRAAASRDTAVAALLAVVACLATLLATAAAAFGADERAVGAGSGDRAAPALAVVRPGLECLVADGSPWIAGRRVGLITNPTGVARDGRSAIDLIAAMSGARLVALFGPEHGLRGAAGPGERVASGRDERTGLPIHSLYDDATKPSPEALEGIDALVFDVQDAGARYFTYLSTMALAMEAAAEGKIPFVVLDRPNPLGGERVQGNVAVARFAGEDAPAGLPMRHGMTAGEVARLYNERICADLRVVPAAGWSRRSWLDETGLPWVAPSPNLRSIEALAHYPGTCLFEGTNLSVGRGTDEAFAVVGAPWLDADVLARRLEARRLDGKPLRGVRFEAVSFTPRDPGDGLYDGEIVRGIRFVVTDRAAYDPCATAVAALLEARDVAGERWEWRAAHFDHLAGGPALREAIERAARDTAAGTATATTDAGAAAGSAGAAAEDDAGAADDAGTARERAVDSIVAGWRRALEEFEASRRRFLLYE